MTPMPMTARSARSQVASAVHRRRGAEVSHRTAIAVIFGAALLMPRPCAMEAEDWVLDEAAVEALLVRAEQAAARNRQACRRHQRQEDADDSQGDTQDAAHDEQHLQIATLTRRSSRRGARGS